MGYLCPVCGYDEMQSPPEDYYICPSCGTEFGYEDFAETYEGRVKQWERLRRRWLLNDMAWFSPVIPPPSPWHPYTQLLRAISVTFDTTEADSTETNAIVHA
jgi:hypothetical protein